MNFISSKQLQTERECIQKKLSQNVPDFSWRSHRLLDAFQWIEYSIQNTHELHTAIKHTQHKIQKR